MRHLGVDLRLHRDAHHPRQRRDPRGVVTQHLVVAGDQVQRRQILQVGEHRRDEREVGPQRTGQDPGDHPLRSGAMHQQVLRDPRPPRLPTERQVGPGREQDGGVRLTVVQVADLDQRAQRQPAPGRVPRDEGGLRVRGPRRPVARHPGEGGDRVAHGGRAGMLGRQPVVERQHRHARRGRQPAGQVAMRRRAAQAVAAAVQVEDAPRPVRARREHPLGRRLVGPAARRARPGCHHGRDRRVGDRWRGRHPGPHLLDARIGRQLVLAQPGPRPLQRFRRHRPAPLPDGGRLTCTSAARSRRSARRPC